MIVLTKLNGTQFVLNDDLIETIDENPDTTIRLTTTHYHIVKESMLEVIDKVITFRREINQMLPGTMGYGSGEGL